MFLLVLTINKAKLSWCFRFWFSFAKVSPVSPPSLPPSVLRGRPQRYLGPLPEGPADSAERARLGGEGGRNRGREAERGTSISLQDDKLTLGEVCVTSRRSQLIIALAAPASFLWPSLPRKTSRGAKLTTSAGPKRAWLRDVASPDGGGGGSLNGVGLSPFFFLFSVGRNSKLPARLGPESGVIQGFES